MVASSGRCRCQGPQGRRVLGLLSARYGITEGSAREAYVVATGAPWNSLDYRKHASE
jgi:hypothetical protein